MIQLLALFLTTTALAGAEDINQDDFGEQEGREVVIKDFSIHHHAPHSASLVKFMLPSTALVHGPPTKPGPQLRVFGNAMCDLYPHAKKVDFPYTSPLGEIKCAQAQSEKACRGRCEHESTCTGELFHPI